MCPFHPEQEINSFCEEEKLPLCPMCAVAKHSGHSFSFLCDTVPKIKEEIVTKIKSVICSVHLKKRRKERKKERKRVADRGGEEFN